MTMPSCNEIVFKVCNPDSSRTLNVMKHEYPTLQKQNYWNSKPQGQKSSKTTNAKSNKSLIGLSYGLLSGFSFAACAASVKYLEDLHPGQVAFYQYIAIAVFSLPMVVKQNKSLLGPEKSTKYWLLLSGIFSAVTVYLAFISFRYLPLSDATVLTSSVPVFVTISARIFLKERCGISQILAIVISVLGVALVSKVPLLLAHRTDVYTPENIIGLLAAFGSIATESGDYIILRKLHDVNVFIILFNSGIVATAVNAMLTFAFGSFTWTSCGVQQLLVVAVGVFSFLSEFTLTKALEVEEAGPVSVLMAAGDIILAFILDMILFNAAPDLYTISGAILVVLSVMLVGFKTWLEGNPRDDSTKQKIMPWNFFKDIDWYIFK